MKSYQRNAGTVAERSQAYSAIPEVINMPPYFYDAVTDFLGPLGNQRVVDVGCGNGYLLQRIYKTNPGLRLTGVDFAEGLLANARQLLPHASFIQADLDSGLPLSTDSQDVVIITEVLEHLTQPALLLQESQRILAPGGSCIITFPNVDGWLLYRLIGEPLVEWAQKVRWLELLVPGEHPTRTLQPIDALLHFKSTLALIEKANLRITTIHGEELLPDLFAIKGFRRLDYFYPNVRRKISHFATQFGLACACYRAFVRCAAT